MNILCTIKKKDCNLALEMNIFSATWNTHGFCGLPDFVIDEDYDLITISLQECYYPPNIKDLFADYRVRIVESLFGLQTIILSKTNIRYKVNKIGFGPFGLPNKGFIAITINDTILYINAHLSAHEYNQKKRLEQINKAFGYVYTNQIETIILSGDLNFRISGKIDQATDFFKEYKNFKEENIKFPHTYKYKGEELDNRRNPAYCDRIIIASKHTTSFIEYSSIHEVNISDHKPVILKFLLEKPRNNKNILNIKRNNLAYNEKLSRLYQIFWKNKVSIAFFLIFCIFALFYIYRNMIYRKN